MEETRLIFTDQIDDPINAMRSDIDRNKLFELADNIKQNGLINPITVRPVGDRYEVVAGHRRISACKIAGIIKIQCVVRNLTDEEVFRIKASENLEREDVDPVDEAIFLMEYKIKTGKNNIEIAKDLRRSVGYVETRLAVGEMPDYMKVYLKLGDLKLGVALALIQINEEPKRQAWVDMAVRDGVSVAQAEYWLHGHKIGQLPGGSQSEQPPEGSPESSANIVKFECALTGRKEDARLFKSIFILEECLPDFFEIAKIYRFPVSSAESLPENS